MITQIEARKLILHALYHDNWLYNQLVLKGGNALSMIYGVGLRTSLDLDFSISKDFTDPEEVSDRIEKALIQTFKDQKTLVFDFSFNAKPKKPQNDWWGGYRAEFKLISEALAEKLEYNIEHLRRQSLPVDIGSQKRKYSIEISKFEYIEGHKIEKYEGMDILVYSPLLLAVEKLRALLQQHPEYSQISADVKRSRSRDLYDIWVICDHFAINLGAHLEVVQAVFNAKKVSMDLLRDLETVKALHHASWSDVELSVTGEIEDFDFYFEYVSKFSRELYTKWKIDSP
jgi:predicted nucleotidyltransferase component of viral defense system